MEAAERGKRMPRSVVEKIIREAPLDDQFGDDIKAAFDQLRVQRV